MKGYKVFNPDWTCRGFQYEVGKTFEEDVVPKCCDRGFHFCTKASDCFNYYIFDPNNKVAEVEALGDIDTQTEDTKCSTNKLHIIREITWQEVLELVNLGKGCTGLGNSGHYNSGNRNSGYYNSGNDNSGDWNSGGFNSGDFNSGHYNSGDGNTGDWNSGHWNTGDGNSGDWNTGDGNSGDWNTGDWNKASNVAGCFNTKQQKLKFFDEETDITLQQWRDSYARYLMSQINFSSAEWISSSDMTDKEKEEHPEYETTEGYLKICDTKNACIEWWKGLSKRDKNIIRSIPNFDAEKFYQITGIRA